MVPIRDDSSFPIDLLHTRNPQNRISHKQTSKVSKRITSITDNKNRSAYQSTDNDLETGSTLTNQNSQHTSSHVYNKTTNNHISSNTLGGHLDTNSNMNKEQSVDLKTRNLSILSTQSLPSGMNKERIADLQSAIDDMFNKMKENRAKARRPNDVDKMTDEEITKEKQELQQLLLRFEDNFGRPKERVEKDIVRLIYDRYRVVKRALNKKQDKNKEGTPI